MARFALFRSALGLNNVNSPNRLIYHEDGACELAEAVNVIIDDSGSARRRYGTEVVVTGASRSLWSEGSFCFFVSDGNLYRLRSDETTVLVASGVGSSKMHYATMNGKVYCSNGSFRAIIDDTTISSWDASIPTQTTSDTRILGIPSSFTKIFSFNGRMYCVSDNILYESEPFNPSCFDMANGFIMLDSSILDAVSVRGGIYITKNDGIWFLSGSSKSDFTLIHPHPSQVVTGTMTCIPGGEVGNGDMIQGVGVIFVCKDGVCVGDESGRVTNMTSRKLVFDSATSGAGCYLPNGQYIFSLEV